MFLFGFGMASVAKAQQKMSNPCTSKSRNLELHFTMSVFLLAASLDFQLYWRALPSFPVLANTGISSCLTANPATALQPGWFEDSFHPKRCQNDAQGAQKSRKMNPGAPKGGPMRKRTIFWTYFPSHLGTHFDTCSPNDEKK